MSDAAVTKKPELTPEEEQEVYIDGPLFEARKQLFTQSVWGQFRKIKWAVLIATLGVYYFLPFVRWDRGPNAPDQAVLIDLPARRFYFFFIEIWPQEVYYLTGLLILASLILFLMNAVAGRIWCGYLCPQTVWTDLFITVERWIEGDRNARVRLWRQPWTLRKLRLYGFKWTVWLLIALATGGAWVFYFTDAPTLARDLVIFDAHPAAYITIAILTATTFFFGGFFREQICIYACPWPRIQAAMMDEDTLTIGYRDWRGEPRGKHRKGPGAANLGDCIDCSACVNVCPMGIDIRDGQQLACITCGLCIDACNDVMDRVGKPRDLIGYMALSDERSERVGAEPKPVWSHVFRPRTILYSSLWAAVGVGLLVALFVRADFDMAVAPERNPTFITLSNGDIRNAYEVRLRNMEGAPRDFTLAVQGADGLELAVQGAEGRSVTVAADRLESHRVYLTAPADSDAARTARTDVEIVAISGDEEVSVGTVFNGRGE